MKLVNGDSIHTLITTQTKGLGDFLHKQNIYKYDMAFKIVYKNKCWVLLVLIINDEGGLLARVKKSKETMDELYERCYEAKGTSF